MFDARARNRPARAAHRWPVRAVLCACLVVATRESAAQPAQIILLRHAEKPADEGDLGLSPRGEDRARALVGLLGRGSVYTTNAPVAALYATRVTKRNRSQRTGETLAPLATDLALPVNTQFSSGDYAALASSLLSNPAYRGRTVIICWTHSELARLALALGVKPRPVPWKDKVFDRLWIVRLTDAGVALRDVPEDLLPGDAKH